MSQLILNVPDDSLLSLKLSDEAAGAEIRLAASVKLYELGRLSSGAAARLAGNLGDAVGDEVNGIETRHVLHLQEIDRMRLAFRKKCHEHVRPGDLVTAGGLNVDDRALHDALETCGGLGIRRGRRFQALQFVVDEVGHVAPDLHQIDATGPHHRNGVDVVDQRQQQVFERGVFVPAFGGQGQSPVQRLLKVSRQHRSILIGSVFLDRALQGVLMLPGEIHDLVDLGLRDLVRKHTAHANAAMMNVQHDPHCILVALAEELLQHVNDEFHRRVIVVQHQDLVHRRLFRLGADLGHDAS